MKVNTEVQYEAQDTGNVYEVVAVDEHLFDGEMSEVHLEPVGDGKAHSVFADVFESSYTAVDSELTEDDIEEIKNRRDESWTQLAVEFNVSEDDVRSAILA